MNTLKVGCLVKNMLDFHWSFKKITILLLFYMFLMMFSQLGELQVTKIEKILYLDKKQLKFMSIALCWAAHHLTTTLCYALFWQHAWYAWCRYVYCKSVLEKIQTNKAVILNQTWESAVTKDEENKAKFIHKFRIYRLFTFTTFSSIGIAYTKTPFNTY